MPRTVTSCQEETYARSKLRARIAMLYSITSTARASRVVGIVMPSAFAVLRLITSSYFGRGLHRKVGHFGAFQYAIGV